jgi:hypothetical protein
LVLIPQVSQGGEPLATEPNYFGLASLLVVGLVAWWVLRRLARRGVAGEASDRMQLGLGQAMLAVSALLQPHTPGPEDRPGGYSERDDDFRSRKPDPDRAPKLFEDGEFPADGLRTRLDDPAPPRPPRPSLRVVR